MTEPITEYQRSAEEEARHCVRCGLCLSVCPGYRESLNETDSPRARVALLQAVKEGLFDDYLRKPFKVEQLIGTIESLIS